MTYVCPTCGHDAATLAHQCCGFCSWHLSRARHHAAEHQPRERHPSSVEIARSFTADPTPAARMAVLRNRDQE